MEEKRKLRDEIESLRNEIKDLRRDLHYRPPGHCCGHRCWCHGYHYGLPFSGPHYYQVTTDYPTAVTTSTLGSSYVITS